MNPVDLASVRRVVPELLEVLRSRVRILQRVYLLQPIGRRALAVELQTTERILRAELDFLRQQGLVIATSAGVSLSEEGERLLDELDSVVSSVEGREELANMVSRMLNIPRVIVVEGDSDEEPWVKDNLGYRTAAYLRQNISSDDILAVTGGTTIAAVAKRMPTGGAPVPVKVVPARGGFGETVDIQANTIASLLAQKLGGSSIMLHVPDRLTSETLDQLLTDPYVQQRLLEIREANVVVHGIGDAMEMAARRRATEEEAALLQANHAVAEAFGYYFKPTGEVAYAMTTVGLKLADLEHMRLVIAVAGGRKKAAAVAAAAKAYRIDVLVTDEGTAKQLAGTGNYEGVTL